ncbi:helix-turn-helix domain-containing protein [Alkalihalobacterium bogoriense]|uniref:helix-turn-helix domain-containing protein n=1 Tax=Alkalihalobacterium bogoriense TaxID=246272 RepID=UPI00047BEA73|nr:helix-turn-helix domain-containing protein [Alkalihalobacterium bogoriense]
MDSNHIQFLLNLLQNSYKVPVMFIGTEKNIMFEYNSVLNPIYLTKHELISTLLNENDKPCYPHFKTTMFETFFLIHVEKNHKKLGTLLIGPFLTDDVAEEMISGLLFDYQIPSYLHSDLLYYFQSLTKLKQEDLLHLAQHAYFLFFFQKLDLPSLQQESKLVNIDKVKIEKELQIRRLDGRFHMDYHQEQYIWQYIREGKKDKLEEHLNQINVDRIGLLSKTSHLRHVKNYCIIGIALASRAAIEGGLYPEIVLTMSDIYIQRIEDTQEVQNVEMIFLLTREYMFELTDRIHASKLKNHSKTIAICKNYIFNHIFEKLTIDVIAKKVHLNPIYLSRLFKKETGLSLGKYIQQEKLNEAKKLLLQSEYTISEICNLLQFGDQSYFASAFKKHTGLTPSQYRKENVLIYQN